MSIPDALIVDAVRSPIGKRNGTLASVRGRFGGIDICVNNASALDLSPATRSPSTA